MRNLVIFFGAMLSIAHAQTGLERQLASAARQREALNLVIRSVELQQASVRTQAGLATQKKDIFFLTMDSYHPEPARGEAECEALPAFEARGMVEQAARIAGIDANLLQAVAKQESAFRPCAVSSKGAQGLMQLMPATALELGVRNPFNPAESLAGGAALLKQLLVRYSGDLNRVLGAYNAGPARVDAAGGVPPIPETVGYVQRILSNLP